MAISVGSGHTLEGISVENYTTLKVLKQTDSISFIQSPGATIEERERSPDGGATLSRVLVRTLDGVSTSALGTYTLEVYKEVDGGVITNSLNSASFNLETLVDQTESELTLSVVSGALDFADGDYLLIKVISDNGDLTGGSGIIVSAIWIITE